MAISIVFMACLGDNFNAVWFIHVRLFHFIFLTPASGADKFRNVAENVATVCPVALWQYIRRSRGTGDLHLITGGRRSRGGSVEYARKPS